MGDFIGAWNSLAANPDNNIARGNFMFGRQAMNLLEFAARLYKNDATGNAIRDYSSELFKIESKYFTSLPSPCASATDFVLPHNRNTSGNLLLWALFDLVRHGLAHQYQQLSVSLIGTLENGGRLVAIDTLTNKVIGTSPIGQAGQAIAYVPDAVPEGNGTQGLQPLGMA